MSETISMHYGMTPSPSAASLCILTQPVFEKSSRLGILGYQNNTGVHEGGGALLITRSHICNYSNQLTLME